MIRSIFTGCLNIKKKLFAGGCPRVARYIWSLEKCEIVRDRDGLEASFNVLDTFCGKRTLLVAPFLSCPPNFGLKAGAVLRFLWASKENEEVSCELREQLLEVQIEMQSAFAPPSYCLKMGDPIPNIGLLMNFTGWQKVKYL